MTIPERIAMCTHTSGENPHIPLKPEEALPTTCFQECDCTPVEFVRVTWIDGEAYSPLTSRERAFQETSVQAATDRDRLAAYLRWKLAPQRGASPLSWDEMVDLLDRFAPEESKVEVVEADDESGLPFFDEGPVVGHCSKCGEARTEVYTCRDGGATVVCPTHGHDVGATYLIEGVRRCGVPCPIATCGQPLVAADASPRQGVSLQGQTETPENSDQTNTEAPDAR